MAGKKIGLVLALDGEKEFTQAVQNAQKSAKLFETELKGLAQQFDGNANSMDYLRQKQEILTKQQDAYQKKVEAAKAGLEHANDTYRKQGERLEELKQKLEEARQAQKKMEDAGETGTDVYEKQTKQVDELANAVDRQTTNHLKAAGRITDWNEKISKSETELRKTNSELQKNEQYLKEAEEATDHCATSIDNMGKEVRETSEDLSDANKKTSTFGDMLKANLTGAAVISGVKKLGDAAKEAAKYVIDAGSSFESAMSEVEAISGASGSDLDAMTEKAKELGESTKFSATEVAEAFKYMSLAGWSTSDMLSGIDGVLNLAAASGMELAEASDMVTDYLSAFGMQASQSAYMADILAYAQANSNTSAQQLGEAYQNCAANMNSAGQDIETTTSLLEAMANQGTKGTKAGTQLSAIMRDITAKMKDGKIAIGDTSVAVTDANGNYRDLTDILTDVETATNGMGTAEKNAALQATFTADSIKGLNLIFNEGMGNVASYETALRNSDGAASDMANTMQDNLKGKITEFNSAVEGLGIQVFDYISGPAQGIVEGATKAINAISEAITPQKTELQTFIEEIEASNDEVQTLLDNAKASMDGSDTEIGNLEAYKTVLLDLNDIEGKTEYQKYQIKSAVDALSGSIPELAAAFDEESGSINLTNQEIVDLIDNQEELIRQQAYAGALKEATEALAMAELNQAKAKSAVSVAQENWNKVAGEGINSVEEYIQAWGEAPDSVLSAERELKCAKGELDDANAATEEAQGIVDDTKTALEGLTDAQGENNDATEKGTDAIESESEALDDLGDSAKSAADIQKEAAQTILDAYESTRAQIESDLQNKISLFDVFDGGADVTTEQMNENLQSFLDGIENYKTNLEKVRNMTDETGNAIFSDEVMAQIEAGGTEYANALAHMVSTWETQGEYGVEQLKGINEKWSAALTNTETISDAEALYQTAIQQMAGELGSTEVEFTGLTDAIETAKAEASGSWEGLSEDTKSALDQVVQTAKDCGVKIPDGLAEGIASGDISPAQAIEQLNGSIQGTFDGLAQMAQEQGITVPEELAAGIENGGQSAVEALNSLIELITDQAKTAKEAGEEVGSETASGAQSSIEDGTPEVEQASSDMASAGATAADGKSSEFYSAGENNASEYLKAIEAAQAEATAKGVALSAAVKNAIASQTGFYAAGVNMSAGVASGISDGASRAIAAARNMASAALAAAKAELQIQSPSKKFRNQVGAQISTGMAFGIKDKASLAGKAAKTMSNKVYTSAVSWLAKYKKSQQTSLEDEKYYWQQVLKHVKSGTTAYKNAMNQLNKVVGQQLGSSELATQINKNFGVSRTTGTGKKKKTKDAETYYSEIYSAAEKYMKNYQLLNEVSLQQELAYWEEIKSRLKSKTQAWYDAESQIQSLQAQIDQAGKDAIATTASVQESILSKYKTYYKVSAKAEAEYWNAARKQFQTGTDERIEADQKYFDALQELYEQRKELDEDYAENSKDINDRLIDDIQSLRDAYTDAVNSRKQDILSQMSLFEAWDSEGYDASTLLNNLKTQVIGLTFWEQQLEELASKGITKGLLEELREMGPDAAASLYSLNQMTAQQLAEYEKLWEKRNALAESQAVKENESLRKETNDQIAQLRVAAQAELNALNAEYRAAISELYTGMSDDLAKLVNKAGTIGEDAVSSLIGSIGKAADSVETYDSTTKVVDTISDQLSYLEREGQIIGKNTLDGLLEGLLDKGKIDAMAREVIQSIKESMEDEAEINSPSKLFRRETGPQIPAGLALGMEDGTKKATKSAREMMQDTLAAAQEEMMKQQAAMQNQVAMLDYSGLNRLNRLMETPIQQSTVVNVDNGGLASLLGTLISAVNGLSGKVENMQVVMDTGELVGAIQPSISQESAAVTVRRNRGRL